MQWIMERDTVRWNIETKSGFLPSYILPGACVDGKIFKVILLYWFLQAKYDHWQMLQTRNSTQSRWINLWKMNQCTCIDRKNIYVRFSLKQKVFIFQGNRFYVSWNLAGLCFCVFLLPVISWVLLYSDLLPTGPQSAPLWEGIGVADGTEKAWGIFRKQRSWLRCKSEEDYFHSRWTRVCVCACLALQCEWSVCSVSGCVQVQVSIFINGVALNEVIFLSTFL